MNFILALILIAFIFLIAILPFWLLYIFADIARFMLQHVFGYRKEVIKANLKRCFPEKNVKEIDILVGKAYKNLTDILVEGLKAFTMTDKQLARRHRIINPEILESYNDDGRSLIATPCHYGNWEWGALAPSLQVSTQIVAFYTKFSNPYVDKFLRTNRSRTGAMLVSTNDTSSTFDARADLSSVYIMAADQSPSKPEKAIWVDFMGYKTAFLNGPEKHARLRNIPVVFVDIQRIKRGFYTLELSILSNFPEKTAIGEITSKYANRLEEVIRAKPENWLWSHKRWKLNKD